ncbi:hypothetical protein VNO78_19650 [Psophocarpus tetragonolobus]|uniref:Uncharacterized protein n=1 Tax=Psophocarpus tetragonolobus TaxID=3891 RepID=A0AAN9XGS5_PSOTE
MEGRIASWWPAHEALMSKSHLHLEFELDEEIRKAIVKPIMDIVSSSFVEPFMINDHRGICKEGVCDDIECQEAAGLERDTWNFEGKGNMESNRDVLGVVETHVVSRKEKWFLFESVQKMLSGHENLMIQWSQNLEHKEASGWPHDSVCGVLANKINIQELEVQGASCEKEDVTKRVTGGLQEVGNDGESRCAVCIK